MKRRPVAGLPRAVKRPPQDNGSVHEGDDRYPDQEAGHVSPADRIESGQQGGAGHIRGDHGWVLAYTFTSEPDDEGVTSEPPEREEPERRSSRQAITAHANAETR